MSRWKISFSLVLIIVSSVLPIPATHAQDDAEDAIHATVAAMSEAVLAGDPTEYLAHVDLSDPGFALEHTRWVEDWAETHPVERFELSASAIEITGSEADARLMLTWRVVDGDTQTASLPARFVLGDDDEWRYAGVAWVVIETEHFRVHSYPGWEARGEDLVAQLPEMYAHVSGSLGGYEPDMIVSIKLYPSTEALAATTRLSLPPIYGWSEPDESIKSYITRNYMPIPTLSHEYTHFVAFDMAGGSHGELPVWAEEGIADYVSSAYWPQDIITGEFEQLRAWQDQDELLPWDDMRDFEEMPDDEWQYVNPQGFAMITYITETYGQDTRNTWLQSMLDTVDVYEATESILGISFDALAQDFDVWLAES